MDIAEAALTTARRQQTHAGSDQIQLVGFALDRRARNSAGRHTHDQILAVAAVLTRAAAVAAAAGLKFALIAKWQQSIEMLIGQEIDMPATAAIAAVGATARYVRFATKARRTVTAVTSLNYNLSTIKKFTSHKSFSSSRYALHNKAPAKERTRPRWHISRYSKPQQTGVASDGGKRRSAKQPTKNDSSGSTKR